MTIGIAIVVVAVMFFIDRHNRWRTAGKIVACLVIAAMLGYGGLLSWGWYSDHRAQRELARQQAQETADRERRYAELRAKDPCINIQYKNGVDWSTAVDLNGNPLRPECVDHWQTRPATAEEEQAAAPTPASKPTKPAPKPRPLPVLGYATVKNYYANILPRCYFANTCGKRRVYRYFEQRRPC
jgi:hypothetical protein